MDIIERIEHFEEIFQRADKLSSALLKALDEYKELLPEIAELKEYYESDLWQRDFEEDEAGRLPEKLKRGVLSEDGVYDLLEKDDEIKETFKF